jgi:carboxymethylenebutenolidase
VLKGANNRAMLWVKRLLLGLGAILLLLILLFAGAVVVDALFTGNNVTELTNVVYESETGESLYGYLALPAGEGPHPAVLLIHEWWGLNEGITILANALAEQGYVVFAPDAYRGQNTAIIPRALWLRLSTPAAQIHADVDAALEYLRQQEQVDPERVASMGFCFGGGQSLQLGLRESEKLAVTIIYYGTLVTDPDLLRPLIAAAPVLGVFGEEDQQVLPADVIEFEAALNSLAIPNEITIYAGEGHAFLNEDNYDQPGPAMEAWQQTLRFLEENLQSAN